MQVPDDMLGHARHKRNVGRALRGQRSFHEGEYAYGRTPVRMSLSAVSRAAAAGTFTSGSTPTPSQFVCVMGLIARAFGTPMMKWSSMRRPETGCAPPPVVSPTIVARFCAFRL